MRWYLHFYQNMLGLSIFPLESNGEWSTWQLTLTIYSRSSPAVLRPHCVVTNSKGEFPCRPLVHHILVEMYINSSYSSRNVNAMRWYLHFHQNMLGLSPLESNGEWPTWQLTLTIVDHLQQYLDLIALSRPLRASFHVGLSPHQILVCIMTNPPKCEGNLVRQGS